MFFKGANPHGRIASGYTRRSVCQPAGINEEGTNLMPHVVHQRPVQTFSREAGAFNTRRLLQSDKDLPAETWPPAQEENARATNLCDSIFYKWVTHLHEAVCKLVRPVALEICQVAHRQAEGLCSGRPLQLCWDHSTVGQSH